jgi:hypothetical protein
MTNEERHQVDEKKMGMWSLWKNYTHAFVYRYKYIHIDTYPHMYKNAYMNMKMHIQFINKNTYEYMYIYSYIYLTKVNTLITQIQCEPTDLKSWPHRKVLVPVL